MDDRKILWKDGDPVVYVEPLGNDTWLVINGAWRFKWDGVSLQARDGADGNGDILTFDRITDAPNVEGDYNAVMAEARRRDG